MPDDPRQVSRALDPDVESWLPAGLLQDLVQSSPQSIGLPGIGTHVENIAFHDFSAYEYIFDPQVGTGGKEPTEQPFDLNPFMPGIQGFLSAAATQQCHFEEGVFTELCSYILRCYGLALAKYYPEIDSHERIYYISALLLVFLGEMPVGIAVVTTNPSQAPAGVAYAHYVQLNEQSRVTFIINDLTHFLEGFALSCTIPNHQQWIEFLERAASRNSIYFPGGTVNFGLRLIYRQEWRTLGDQEGELVRTVPLGPGQKEKVSIKIFRRNKGSRQLERVETTETTTEISESTKDSTEIVEEAASSTKAYVNGEAGYSGFGFSGKISAGYAEEEAQKSSEAKKNLSETMQKTASKMRRETKITVSTESEESFEETHASEIGNPNDEIPITLMYHRLQRAFEVHTYLAEVASVVFVAEEMPYVDENWIKRYDWILAGVLLDPSFREPLEWLSRNYPAIEPKVPDLDADLKTFLGAATTSIGAVTSLPGSITNIYDSALESYRAAAADTMARQREWETMKSKIGRLKQHIRDNLLHYCRAVWSSEDPETRMLRYMNIDVPAKVTWEEPAGAEPHANPPEGPGPMGPMVPEPGSWMISPDIADYVPLSDVINPAGPIGFFGNYAVVHVKSASIVGLNEMLTRYRLKYAEPSALVVSAEKNEGKLQIKGEITCSSVVTYYIYELKFSCVPPEKPRYVLSLPLISGAPKIIKEDTYPDSGIIDLGPTLGFRLTIIGEPANADTFKICASYPELCDPELKNIRYHSLVPDSMDDDLIQEMLTLVPGLQQKLQSLRSPTGERGSVPAQGVQTQWDKLNENQQNYLKVNYHSFLLRREHTRRFVVDTNSLVLDVYTASGSTLEPFKRVHRFIDIMKAATEVERRKKLLARDQLGDPDIERMVVVSQGNAPTPAIVTGVETFNSGGVARTSGTP